MKRLRVSGIVIQRGLIQNCGNQKDLEALIIQLINEKILIHYYILLT